MTEKAKPDTVSLNNLHVSFYNFQSQDVHCFLRRPNGCAPVMTLLCMEWIVSIFGTNYLTTMVVIHRIGVSLFPNVIV